MAEPQPDKPPRRYDKSNRPGFEKLAGVYMRTLDLDRVNRMTYIAKMSHKAPARVGLSILARAGLLLLEREMEKDEQSFINLLNASVAEGTEPS